VSPSLSGKRWRLTEINGAAVEATRAYLEFDLQAMKFSGDGGCNRIAGGFSLNGTQIHFLKSSARNGLAWREKSRKSNQIS
jgi:heat shock protein HslJ